MNKLQRYKGQHTVLLFLALISVLLFAPYLLHPQDLIWPNSGFGADITHMFWPAVERFADQFRTGQLILWDPWVALGRSVPGDVGTLWLYPFNLIFIFVNTALGFTILAILHTFIAGTGMYYLAQRLMNSTRFGALVSGLAFMLSPKIIAHLAGGHLGLVYGLAWMPIILLFAELAYQKQRLGFAVIAGVATAFLFPTHPQIMLMTIYALIGRFGWLFIHTVLKNAIDTTYRTKLFRQISLIGTTIVATAILVGALWWLPILEILPHVRNIEFKDTLFWYQIPWGILLTILSPTNFQFPEWTIYAGSVPLILAMIKPVDHRRSWYLLWVTIIMILLFSVGDATPFFEVVSKLIPGLAFFRAKTRLWFLGLLILCLLASKGADRIFTTEFREELIRLNRKFNLIFASYLLLNIIVIIGLSLIFQELAVGTLHAGLAGLALFITMQFWKNRKVSRIKLQSVIVAALILDLGWLASDHIRPIDPQDSFLQESALITFLEDKVSRDERIYITDGSLSYALLEAKGIESLNGLLNLQVSGLSEIINAATGCELTSYSVAVPSCISNQNNKADIPVPVPKILGILNVKYIVSATELTVDGLELAYADDIYFAYENQFISPRAYLITKTDSLNAAGTDIDISFDDLEGWNDQQAEITNSSPGKLTIRVSSPERRILVFSTAWAPGWQVMIDEKKHEVLRVNRSLLGVYVPEGTSKIEFVYDPISWQIGWRISMFSILIIAIFSGRSYINNSKETK